MERLVEVVGYAMLAGWLASGALFFAVPWAGIDALFDVVFLSIKLKFLIVASLVLSIMLTVSYVVLYGAIERRREKDSK